MRPTFKIRPVPECPPGPEDEGGDPPSRGCTGISYYPPPIKLGQTKPKPYFNPKSVMKTWPLLHKTHQNFPVGPSVDKKTDGHLVQRAEGPSVGPLECRKPTMQLFVPDTKAMPTFTALFAPPQNTCAISPTLPAGGRAPLQVTRLRQGWGRPW